MNTESSILKSVIPILSHLKEWYFDYRLQEIVEPSGASLEDLKTTTLIWAKDYLSSNIEKLNEKDRNRAKEIIAAEISKWVIELDEQTKQHPYLLINKGDDDDEIEIFKSELYLLLDFPSQIAQGSKGRPISKIVHFKDCLRLDNEDFQKLLYVLKEFFDKENHWIGFNRKKSGFGSLMKILMELNYTKDKKDTISYLPIAKAFCNSFLPTDYPKEYIERFRKDVNTTKEDELEILRKAIPKLDEIHLVKLPKK